MKPLKHCRYKIHNSAAMIMNCISGTADTSTNGWLIFTKHCVVTFNLPNFSLFTIPANVFLSPHYVACSLTVMSKTEYKNTSAGAELFCQFIPCMPFVDSFCLVPLFLWYIFAFYSYCTCEKTFLLFYSSATSLC